MQKRILFCWELGANYGHLARLIPVAERQQAAGRKLLFVINNMKIGEELLLPKGMAFVLSPLLQAAKSKQLAVNYAELLIHCGYLDKGNLQVAVGQWLELFKQFQPDLLVIDHSPTVLLANKISNIPVIQIGAGFEIPPADNWFNMLSVTRLQQQVALKKSGLALLNNMNEVIKAFGAEPLSSVVNLFKDCQQVLVTFEELDPYQKNRKVAKYVGHVTYQAIQKSTSWLSEIKKILIYLWPQMPGLNQLLGLLAELEVEVIAIIPDISQQAVANFASANLRIYNHLFSLANWAYDADLLITHGHGTASHLLKHGVPVLLIPKTLEQYLHGQCIEAHSLGLMMPPQRGAKDFEEVLQRLLNTAIYRENAQKYAQKYRHVTEHDAINHITQAINHKLIKSAISAI